MTKAEIFAAHSAGELTTEQAIEMAAAIKPESKGKIYVGPSGTVTFYYGRQRPMGLYPIEVLNIFNNMQNLLRFAVENADKLSFKDNNPKDEVIPQLESGLDAITCALEFMATDSETITSDDVETANAEEVAAS